MTGSAGAPAVISVALLIGALGLKLTDTVKYLVQLITGSGATAQAPNPRKDATNGLVTVLLNAVIGFVGVELLKHTAWGDEIEVGTNPLSGLDFWSTITFGLAFSAVAGTLYDFKKAIDGTDSAKKPKIIP